MRKHEVSSAKIAWTQESAHLPVLAIKKTHEDKIVLTLWGIEFIVNGKLIWMPADADRRRTFAQNSRAATAFH